MFTVKNMYKFFSLQRPGSEKWMNKVYTYRQIEKLIIIQGLYKESFKIQGLFFKACWNLETQLQFC